MQSSAESLLTSVIKRLVRHTEVRVCSRKVIQGHSKARTEDHGWGKRGGTGEEVGFRKSSSPPPGPESHYLMNSMAANQHHNPSRPLSQMVFKEKEG